MFAESRTKQSTGVISKEAIDLRAGELRDYDPLFEAIGNRRFVLIGEASHGTHEFYRERAEITKRLIQEKGFNAVAVEADFPDAYRVNRYVRRESEDPDATGSLDGFKRFPRWMWRNHDVVDFVEWLRAHNDKLSVSEQKIGFYGLDLYSLHASLEAVLTYLDRVDPDGAKRARERYSCFDNFADDTQSYGYATAFGIAESCEREVLDQLIDMHRHVSELPMRDGPAARDDFFFAQQNARLVKNAEEYYRTMYRSDVSSWNLRDRHMCETLAALDNHLSDENRQAKIVIWAHNSHVGDARATEMGRRGEWNVGQLTREQYGRDCFLIGFTTYHGTVTAATNWDDPAERKRVRHGLSGSYEEMFHKIGRDRFMLILSDNKRLKAATEGPLLERAIGVIYRPETERQSHYFRARIADQFDTVIHIDETSALEPLERNPSWERGEVEETFPFGV
jgi:erythromycin esterase-like protein